MEILQPERVLFDGRQAEVVGRAARRNDEEVVRDLAGGRHDDLRVEIDALRLGHQESHVATPAHDGTHRLGDVVGLQPGRRNLVQQGLELMVVVTIDHQHVDGRAREGAGDAQAAEPGTDDDDARPAAVVDALRPSIVIHFTFIVTRGRGHVNRELMQSLPARHCTAPLNERMIDSTPLHGCRSHRRERAKRESP